LIQVAEKNGCAVSAVQAVREHVIPHYGVIGGQRIHGSKDTYKIERVVEKPTPTQAEQHLQIPGLRSGHYLAFFGMHVLTPAVLRILEEQMSNHSPGSNFTLSAALNELPNREQYLGLEKTDWRYDVGTRYGLLKAQLALALNGQDRDLVLTELLELFTSRELGTIGR
jgi:UTP--glucose-1-phosphate uridylyltransferase